jgi:hypoxanthine-DNA glycosylase
MLETHPFGTFVPAHARYLLLGSFTTKEAYDPKKQAAYVWFYSNGGRNQFWPILEELYKTQLQTRSEMQRLFTDLHMALADIIYQCERKKTSNLDINLTNIVYAQADITKILHENKIDKIFFTSRFVEITFRKVFKDLITHYPQVELITLPSPSPRYAQMTKAEKIKRYKSLLPQLNLTLRVS